ncbi:RNA methyltransferase [Domibacillus antri]
MEMRALFGVEPESAILKSDVEIDPSRSPFIKGRIDIMYEGETVTDIMNQVGQIHLVDETFKIIFVKINDLEKDKKIKYRERLQIERDIGSHIQGKVDIHHPDRLFGIATMGGRWYFGTHHKNKAVWLHPLKKPREYSTALSTRTARAICNIAVPHPEDIRVIDPCCGIGTVLVEALSMGIDIVGRDINPLAVSGSRENIAFFGLKGDVTLGPISAVSAHYNTAIIDLPYNHYTRVTRDEQFAILQHARRVADRVIVITIETMDEMLEQAGFVIMDRCLAKKGELGLFSRQILVCE